jgi:hypothetical protein
MKFKYIYRTPGAPLGSGRCSGTCLGTWEVDFGPCGLLGQWEMKGGQWEVKGMGNGTRLWDLGDGLRKVETWEEHFG